MTTNEMIYKTINTKLTKEPVYKSVLEDLGYEVYDSEWSAYNNWTVKNKETGRAVVLSKGYDNKKGLFNLANHIKCADIKKVDYVAYLNKNKNERGRFETPSEYYCLRLAIKESKSMLKWYEKEMNLKKDEIKKLNNDIERYNKYISDEQKRLDDARKRVMEFKER